MLHKMQMQSFENIQTLIQIKFQITICMNWEFQRLNALYVQRNGDFVLKKKRCYKMYVGCIIGWTSAATKIICKNSNTKLKTN